MSSEQHMRAFLAQARQRADKIVTEQHIGADVKSLLADLLQIGENVLGLIDQSQGMSADARVIKKKLEQEKLERRQQDAKLAETKKMLIQLATEIEMVSNEANQIAKRHAGNPTDPDIISTTRIKASVQKIVEVVMHLSRSQSV